MVASRPKAAGTECRFGGRFETTTQVETRRIARTAEDASNGLFFRLTALRKLNEISDGEARASLRRLLSDSDDEVRQLACTAIAENPQPEAATIL